MADARPTVLVAPDSFKGTFGAREVADAIASGVEDAGARADRCPIADGGEGTVDVLLAALGGELRRATVRDPLGRPVDAAYGLLADGTTAVVEAAAASGLGLVAPDERDAVAASTFGTGELIADAIGTGARRVLVAVGGSATSDGGTGAIEAIEAAGGVGEATLEVLCDVTTPFELAAEVFGPQKGATPDQVRALTERLHALAGKLPRDPRGRPRTGAAGGLSGGLWAAFGAGLQAGAPFVLDAIGFDERVRASVAVVAGEGRLDSQTLEGKALAEVAARAAQASVPCFAAVGSCALDDEGRRRLGLVEVIEATTLDELRAAGRAVAAAVRGGSP